jgi:hypothetical protein
LKRKRGHGNGVGERCDRELEEEGQKTGNKCDLNLEMDVSEERRSKKKAKLSHEFDPLSGCSVERRGARVGAGTGDVVGGPGVKTRSRTIGSRRFSTRKRR